MICQFIYKRNQFFLYSFTIADYIMNTKHAWLFILDAVLCFVQW